MTPIADFRELMRGRLVFPAELNGPNRRPHALDTVIRWANEETWQAWASTTCAPIWQWVALQLYLDPLALDRSSLRDLANREFRPEQKTVASGYAYRLQRVLEHLPTGNLPGVLAEPLEESIVAAADFVEWARVYKVPLPPSFPGLTAAAVAPPQSCATLGAEPIAPFSRPPTDAPTARRREPTEPATSSTSSPTPRRRRPRAGSASPDGFLRAKEVLELVPFSAATLWRLCKAGEFPSPLKLSKGVTAWKRSDVDAWRATHCQQASTELKKRRAASRVGKS
ncbi:helix-turn-helix transcriptional regulator [Rubrivivax gelatinosus]|uniref:helix-turn-helix transcriptional regulator n=1 Tax=Rubrivivax gelatinosus TaxID=28068 RepID=UPI00068036DC|nr:AlpA family phage regulatory protein [Rubrivivax gelatinosus]MBG6082697.1 putative DNA-binding transcriptional regulator AlpA [Rubrivivax gelatinosus]